MLKSLLLVWILSTDLSATQTAYTSLFNYQEGESGFVSSELAYTLERPELEQKPYITLYPPAGPRVGLRFIESEPTTFYPMHRVGWSAIELLVKDPDLLKQKLAASPFKHLAGPDFLTEQKNIYAMQMLGPSNELLYLTYMIDPSKSVLEVPKSPTEVGHTFIMVAGSSNLTETVDFFRTHFENPVTDAIPFKIEVLSDAYSLDNATKHNLALVTFADKFALEIDQYPETARSVPDAKPNRGGVILVTANVDLDRVKQELPWAQRYVSENGTPVGGVVKLPSGTPLELIHSPIDLPTPHH
jgi:hypothetical protein